MTNVTQTLDITQIWLDFYDNNSTQVSEIVQDMCSSGTILAETYAFYDDMFGNKGAIRNYYELFGLGEPVNETFEFPNGFVDAVTYLLFSEYDYVYEVSIIQKHHLFITDEAAVKMQEICNQTVATENADLLFDIVQMNVANLIPPTSIGIVGAANPGASSSNAGSSASSAGSSASS